MVTLVELLDQSHVEIGEIYRRTNITATLHRSGLYGSVVKLNLSEDKRKHIWNFQKVPKGPSDSEKQDYLVWSSIISNQIKIKSLLLSHHHSTSALVSEILTSVFLTVQKKFFLHMDSTYLQTVQKTMCKIHIHILSTHSVL